MRAAMTGLFVLVLAGCGRTTMLSGPHHVFEFAVLGNAQTDGSGDRMMWHVEGNDLTVTAQRIASSAPEVGTRTLDGVSDALARRWALQEIPGGMHSSHCAVGAASGRCFVGWSARRSGDDHGRVERSGVLVPVNEDFYFVEVLGSDRAAVDREAGLVRGTFRVL